MPFAARLYRMMRRHRTLDTAESARDQSALSVRFIGDAISRAMIEQRSFSPGIELLVHDLGNVQRAQYPVDLLD